MNSASFRPDFEKCWLIFIAAMYIPAVAAYGWRVFALGVAAAFAGQLTTVVCCRLRGCNVTARGCVLWALLPLALPPAIPWWIIVVGAVFGEAVARQLFGGYGRNLVNPLAAAVVFLGISYPGIIAQSGLMPGLSPSAGFLAWINAGPACPTTPEAVSVTSLLLAKGPALPGDVSVALACVVLALLWKKRALHATFLLGAVTGLVLAAMLHHALKPAMPPAFAELVTEGGFATGLAAAGLDVFSLSRTPGMRLPAGIIYGMLYALLRPAGGAVPPAFAALLLVNILTPLGDALIIARKARQWIVTDGRPA